LRGKGVGSKIVADLIKQIFACLHRVQ
jgi:hypothetical protein